jgi:Lactoylglutathione lyase and related lyases
MFVVEDIEKSKKFYKDVFDLRVTADWGDNVTFAGGFLALQTRTSWAKFIAKDVDEIKYDGSDTELYLTEVDFDSFVEKLKSIDGIELVHDVIEHEWGQKVIRFYDLDKHIIEVGEDFQTVCKRHMNMGKTIEQISELTHLPLKYLKRLSEKD